LQLQNLILIKKLDIFIIRSFTGPFIVTFFVSLFVLVMQFFWLYMDELLGKGLGSWMILQLLFYMSSTMVPMALPLGVLLASIMTFGNMGENYELVAIKSSGISLLRFMRPLLILMFIIAGGAFVFNNNVIPVANLKALSLLYNLRNSKPTLNIRAGQFNSDITNYAIKIGSKDEDGRHIKNVIIYDQSSGMGNDNVVLAEKGEMFPSKDKHYLVFRLQNGWRYTEESNRRSMYGNQESIQTRMYFKQYDKIFDLSGFKINNTSQELFKGNYQMLNVAQLAGQIDTIHQNQQREIQISERYISPYVRLASAPEERKKLLEKITSGSKTAGYRNSFLERVPDSLRTRVAEISRSNIRNQSSMMGVTASSLKFSNENLRKYAVALHQKFTLSVACILLFLIGAPLGAIIRKGGLGLPIVVAVAFFVFYHIMSITGEKLAITGTLPPAAGMWLATALLLPIAFFIIRAARNDSQLFSKDFYLRIFDYFKNLFSRYSKSKAI
jgi:lipopolysaccharide export system permease protein